MIDILMVNYDADALERNSRLHAKDGISTSAASTMPEALDMLLAHEYAGIIINADDFEYLPFLKVMRALTGAPIIVSATHYDEEENGAALQNGASVYRIRFDAVEYRAKHFSELVKIYLALNMQKRQPAAKIACGDIRLDLEARRAFVKDQEIRLKKTGFDILCYLSINKGLVLSHEQILCNVWRYGYEYISTETLRNHIGDIRRELNTAVPQSAYIRTVRGVGYAIEG